MPDRNEPDDEELQANLRKAFGHGADESLDPEIQDSMASDLSVPDTSELDKRLKAAMDRTSQYKENRAQTTEELAKARKSERADARGLGVGLQIAYTIIGFPLLGFGLGVVLDAATKANIWKGFLGLGGCVLAIVAAMILINRATSEIR